MSSNELPMRKLISIILISYIIYNTPVHCNYVIKLKFSKGDILAIYSSDICFRMFEFFSSKKNTLNDKQNYDLTKFSKDTFNLIVALCIRNKSVKLTTKLFTELIILLDFLKVIENNWKEEIEIFWYNLILSILFLITDQKINLTDEEITILFNKKFIIVKLFARCLQYLSDKIHLELKNHQLRIYLNQMVEEKDIERICIENYYDTYFDNENLEIKSLIYWFVRSLNLPRILLFKDDNLMIIILFSTIFDREYKIISVPLSESIMIIKTEFQPKILLLINVINKGDDLKMLSILSSVKELKIQNSLLVDINISSFEMIGLNSLYILLLKIPISDLYLFSKSENLIRLIITGCNLISKDNCNLYNQLKFNISELTIQNCIIDDLFFKWYVRLDNIKSLTFFDNKSKNDKNYEEFDDLIFDKLLKYQACCFKKQDIRNLIVKDSLQVINIRCVQHGSNFDYTANTSTNENVSSDRHECCCVINKIPVDPIEKKNKK